jgi:hypothetical protein
MGRRTLNRREMRNDFEAAERREKGDEKEKEEKEEKEETDEDVDEDEDDEDEDEESSDDDAEGSDEDGESGDDDDEDAPKKKKAKAKPKAKAPAKPKRTRAAKVVRMRVVWGVFSNNHQMVATYEYPKKAEAEAHAAKLMADKKQTHFIQPVKEAIEEKKDK